MSNAKKPKYREEDFQRWLRRTEARRRKKEKTLDFAVGELAEVITGNSENATLVAATKKDLLERVDCLRKSPEKLKELHQSYLDWMRIEYEAHLLLRSKRRRRPA